MTELSKKTMVILTVLVVVLIIYSIVYWTSIRFKSDEWVKYTSTLFHLGILFSIAAVFFGQRSEFLAQEEHREETMVNLYEKSFISIDELFLSQAPKLNAFYQQITGFPETPVMITPDVRMMSSIIFHHIEEIQLVTKIFNVIPDPTWIARLEQWFASPALRQCWKEQRNLFSTRTCYFIDLLISQEKKD